MELDLTLLELPLAGLEVQLVQGLDGILDSGVDIDGLVDGSIGALTKDSNELQTACENLAQSLLGRGVSSTERWRSGRGRQHGGREEREVGGVVLSGPAKGSKDVLKQLVQAA